MEGPSLRPSIDSRRHSASFAEPQFIFYQVPLYQQHIAGRNLPCGDQIRERDDQVALDGPFKRPGAVSPIISLIQQKSLYVITASEHERTSPRRKDAALHHLQLKVENPANSFLVQRIKNHDLIQPVHEFR